jgi:2,4-dienoyl-CoA reductase [(3E)-enoyl-CoA-producing], peroxisomal
MDSPFKADILAGRTCLITGGSSGIGLEISRQLGLHGANVVISGRREAVLKDASASLASEGIHAHYVQGDVRSQVDAERMVSGAVDRFGGLDVLVNAAAGNFLAPAEQLSSNGFKTVIDIDAVGTFNACRAAFPHLRSSQHACIVNISATLHYGATWYQVHASAAKAAVDSLTRTLALEWGPFGIRVCGVAPGPIEGTAGLTKLAPGGADAMRALWKERVPLGRPGQKLDIANAVLFLTSSAGSYVTGHTLVADGGEWMWRAPLLPREQVIKASRAVEAKSRGMGTASLSKL